MGAKRFSNQTKEQVVKHLSKLLSHDSLYNLRVDPLGIFFEIKESLSRKKKLSDKRGKIREHTRDLSKGKRKKLSTNKNMRPKIRTVKKGRTVSLKGRVY